MAPLVPGRVASMADRVWTAAELEKLSPAQRQQIFDASLVLDLDDVPPEFLDRVRDRVQDRKATTDTPTST